MKHLDGSVSLLLQTRMENDIENRQEAEYSIHRRDMEELKMRSEFPLLVAAATLRRRPSNLYNCHGMTFAGRRTGIREQAVIKLILSDDGYSHIQPKEVLPGDIVLYFEKDEITHSGIVVSEAVLDTVETIKVLSKWGGAGEYIHRLRDVPPVYGTRVRFFREDSRALSL
jgi:hypothetical protein